MHNLMTVKQVLLAVLARRKRWILLIALAGAAISVPAAWMLSKEPPRFSTGALVLIESRPDRVPLFQDVSPYRPLAIHLAILRSRSLAESVIEALPRASVEDLVANPYGRDWSLEAQNWVRRLRGEEVVVESPQRRALSETSVIPITAGEKETRDSTVEGEPDERLPGLERSVAQNSKA